jgi:hypothetical protein
MIHDRAGLTLSKTDEARRTDLRHFRTVMIILAIGTVSAGLGLYLVHDQLRLTLDEARDVGSVFLLAGMADTLVLYYWDRIFGTKSI